MALQKQSVPVLFNQGVNTKESKFTLQSGLLELENSAYDGTNIKLRNDAGGVRYFKIFVCYQ